MQRIRHKNMGFIQIEMPIHIKRKCKPILPKIHETNKQTSSSLPQTRIKNIRNYHNETIYIL